MCIHCQSEMGAKPAKHRCNPIALPDNSSQAVEPVVPSPPRLFNCGECDGKFTSRKGLNNHDQMHKRKRLSERFNPPPGPSTPAAPTSSSVRRNSLPSLSRNRSRRSSNSENVFPSPETISIRVETNSAQQQQRQQGIADHASPATSKRNKRARLSNNSPPAVNLADGIFGSSATPLSVEQPPPPTTTVSVEPTSAVPPAPPPQTSPITQPGRPPPPVPPPKPRSYAAIAATPAPPPTPPAADESVNLPADDVFEDFDGSIPPSQNGSAPTSENGDGDDDINPTPATQVSGTTPNHINPEDVSVLHQFTQELRQIYLEECNDGNLQRFYVILEEITEAAKTELKIPPPRPRSGPPPVVQLDDSKFMQKLYHRNRRRAIRLITEGESGSCPVELSKVEEFFTERRAPKPMDPTFYPPSEQQVPGPMQPFTAAEVADRLRKFENTAPGDDQLTYRHWRSLDPAGDLMVIVFNICLKYRRIPPAWKTSKTILIYKKGDVTNLSNWRPISILRTIYRWYSGLLTARLSSWLEDNNILSPAQKGFLPADGVFEHNFTLTYYMNQARTNKTDFHVAWLDFSDAFGSVPHEAPVAALRHYGAGEHICDIVADMYRDVTTSVCTPIGSTNPINIQSGVHQGDPLSGILFNIVINPILERVEEGAGDKHGALAFADDITPMGWSKEELQRRIDIVVNEGKRISILPNSNKCVSLHLSGKTPVGTRNTIFNVDGKAIRALQDGESTKFLGKPVGYMCVPLQSDLQKYIDTGTKILRSCLSPWQKIDAMKTFFYSSLVFPMRMGQFLKGDWEKLDNALRPLIKSILHIPIRATNHYLYGSTRGGAVGIPMCQEECDLFAVDTTYKLLTSPDPIVRAAAELDLNKTIHHRLSRPATREDQVNYLSGYNEGEWRLGTNPHKNFWTQGRTASTRLALKWFSSENAICIRITDTNIVTPKRRKAVASSIRNMRKKLRDDALRQSPDQGKVIECVAQATASHSFIRSGSFIRFADWRFIHRARLNLVPLNAAIRWNPTSNKSCRRCGHPEETLPHVLNHCMRYSQAYLKRHNTIVERIKVAAKSRFEVIGEDNVVDSSGLRPDLVIRRNRDVFIVDVTCPFDNRLEAFETAAAEKVQKYQALAERFKTSYNYRKVEVVPFIVGALGSWYPGNDAFMGKLCSRKYAAMMRKLCVTDAIRWSRDIYIQHITNKQQY